MNPEANREKLWGPHAKRFVAVPFDLILNYKKLGLRDKDLITCIWILAHQWNEKAAFPHPNGLADVMYTDYDHAARLLKSLSQRGFIILEPTRSNPTNFYQDLRPLRNKLWALLEVNQEGIDTSNNRTSLTDEPLIDPEIIDSNTKDTPIDTSRRQASKKGPTQIGDVFSDYFGDEFNNLNS